MKFSPNLPQRVIEDIRSGERFGNTSFFSDSNQSSALIFETAGYKSFGVTAQSKKKWCRVEFCLGAGYLKQACKYELHIKVAKRSNRPLQALMLIVRSNQSEEACLVAQNLRLPNELYDQYYPIEWQHDDIEGEVWIAFQTGSSMEFAIADISFNIGQPRSAQFIESSKSRVRPTQAGQTSVIVCIHNALADVKKCLESIAVCCRRSSAQLIIVDDGSAKETRLYIDEFIIRADFDVGLIRDHLGSGYTKAVNRGLSAVKGDICVMLNSDTIVRPDLLEDLSAHLNKSGYGLVGPLSNRATLQSLPKTVENGEWAKNDAISDLNFVSTSNFLRESAANDSPLIEVALLNGFCIAMKTSVLTKIGLFDEIYFSTGYGEETDFEIRCHEAGIKSAVILTQFVYHSGSQSYASFDKSSYSDRAYAVVCAKHSSDSVVHLYQSTREVLEKLTIRLQLADFLGIEMEIIS